MLRRYFPLNSLCLALVFSLVLSGPAHSTDIARLMAEGDVPGLSMAVIRDGKVVQVSAYGLRNTATGQPVDEHTIFNAASLSKPVFAYAVLQLADAGKLSLDAPLSRYLPNYIPGDPRAATITARQVLSHTSGLPNGVSDTYPLKTYFAPGERFSYSGEGFLYLQKAVETITGEDMEATVKRLVFDPLGMRDSSYVWQARFDTDYAEPYDSALTQGIKPKYHAPKAAWSLETTATDYAKFLRAVLTGAGLKDETARQWLTPQVRVTKQGGQSLDGNEKNITVNVAWGLGWGLEPDQGTFFHWGDAGWFKAFVIGSVRDRSAAVVFTNAATGLSIMPDLIAPAMPGDRPAFAWLNYPRYDAPDRRLIHAALNRGIETAWRETDHAPLDEATRGAIATDLSERGREDDALWLRQRNVADFLQSAECHYELGESDLDRHRPDDALAEFKRTLELDPKRSRTASLVKLLETKAFPSPVQTGRTELRLAGFPNARRIAAVGTFNAWETASLPMRRTDDGWSVKTDLPPGSYLYAFSVDGTLIPDPANPQHATANPESASVLKVDAVDGP